MCRAGSATASNVKDVADAAVTNAKENLAKAKASFSNVIPKDKVSDASSAIDHNFAVSDASGVINDAKSAAADAKSKAAGGVGDAQGFFSSLGDKLTGNTTIAGDVASDAKNKAGDVVSDAQSKLSDQTF